MNHTMYKKVHIEITNVCNLQCSFCPEVHRTKNWMSVDQYRLALSKVADSADWICLHLMGEPTAHPQFAEICRITLAQGKPIYLVTNGVLIDRHRELLTEAPFFHQINFSLQSYWDNFPHRPLEPYLDKLISAARLVQSAFPKTYINFRFWDDGEISDQSNYCLNYLTKAYANCHLKSLSNGANEGNSIVRVQPGRNKRVQLSERTYVHFDSRFEWPSLEQPDYGSKGRCNALQTHIGIHADGTVVPCCLDKEAALALGNLFETDQTLDQIVQSRRAQNILNGFKAGERTEELCRHCQFINRFKLTPSQSLV